MEFLEIARYVAALLLVLALIGGAGLVARKWGVPGVARAISDKRLAVVETLMIGPRQKLFIVRRDQSEHLIFSGPEGCCLVENIMTPSAFAGPRASYGISPSSADARGGAGPVQATDTL